REPVGDRDCRSTETAMIGPMRAPAIATALLALFAGCHSQPPEAKRPSALPPIPALPNAVAPAAEYVPSEDLVRSNAHLAPTPKNPDGGMIVTGVRVGSHGQVAPDLVNPALFGGARVPAFQGGGFLFWNGRALYFAKTFLAPLEPLFGLPTTVL